MASALRAAARSRGLLRPALVQWRRAASQSSGQSSGALTWYVAGLVGVAGATSFAIYRTTSSKSDRIGMASQKTSEYKKAGAVHPEAVAEQMLSERPPKDPPKTKPIVTTEMMGSSTAPPQPDPDTLPLPSHVPYVLVGAGTASFAAAKAIKEKDAKAKILIIGEEEYTPYSRPPLSKQLWLYEDHEATKQLKFKASWSGGKLVDVFYKANFVDPRELPEKEEGGIAVLSGKKVVAMNPVDKKVSLADGTEISYDKCLLATGGQPKNLPMFAEAEPELKKRISLYRAIPDYLSLDKMAGTVGSVLIVGGGFLGSELAVGLASRGREKGLKVIQLFPEDGNLGLVLPSSLCKWTTEKVREEGVEVYPNSFISTATCEDGKVKVTTNDGTELQADHVVVAVGLQPSTELAESARLEVDPKFGGFRVNAELQACSDVWAAGDAACFFDPYLGRRRVEHHDHANVSGRLAGQNMSGEHQRFTHQSMFWSDVGPEVGFEATGIIDAKLPTNGYWARKQTEESDLPTDDYSKGVLFYLNEQRKVVGILTWNLFGKMDLARKVIADEKTDQDLGEIAAMFDIHDSDQNQ